MPADTVAMGVGTWELDVRAQLCFCDATFAAIHGLSPSDGEKGISIERLDEAFHPDDRPREILKRALTLQIGGLFVHDYRVVRPDGTIRWVLSRGLYERDTQGMVDIARGIIIDVTESWTVGFANGHAHLVASREDNAGALVRAADHAMATRRAVDELGTGAARALRPLIDSLLMEIGRRLQRDTGIETIE